MGLKHALLTFLLALCCHGFLEAQVIYVSPQGNDKAAGTKKNPIATGQKIEGKKCESYFFSGYILSTRNGSLYIKRQQILRGLYG